MLKKTLLASATLLFAAGAANAADMVDVAPVTDWSGFYVGVHGGYGWANFDGSADIVTGEDTPEFLTGFDYGQDLDGDGFFAGLQAGFNWQMDSIVLGIEGDISKSWIGADNDVALDLFGDPAIADVNVETDTSIDWFGTARLRAGFLATPDLLLYATGGLAWGSVDTDVDVDVLGFAGDFSDGDSTTHMGWTIGAGLEYAVSEAVSIKAEYLYIDLGEEDVLDVDLVTGDTLEAEQDVNFHTVKAGLNFRF